MFHSLITSAVGCDVNNAEQLEAINYSAVLFKTEPMLMTSWIRASLVLAGIAFAAKLQAAIILVDFNDVNDSGAVKTPDDSGNYWNTVAVAGTTSLIDTANAETGFTLNLALGAGTGFAVTGAAINDPGPGNGPLNQPFAYIDGIFSNTNTGTGIVLTLNSLLPNTTYDFSIYGGRDSNSAPGNIALTTGLGSGLTGDTVLENRTLANFSITSNASGVIGFSLKDTNANTATTMLNAMSFSQAVPEPSYAFIALLGISFVCLRRRSSEMN